MFEAVTYEKKNQIAVLTMNRPEAMNVVNGVMRKELKRLFLDFRDDTDARVLIITGSGEKAFSTGADLKEMAAHTSGEASADKNISEEMSTVMSLNYGITKPIIAAINGLAIGGGLEIALGCDLRIASDNARMGFFEPKRGIMPSAGGVVRLPRMVPLAVAMEILLIGDLISSQEAYRVGLVNRVVPSSQLMNTAQQMAEKLVECAPLALKSIKQTVFNTLDMSLNEALRGNFGSELFATDDVKEGTAAFIERRKPVWKGR